MLEKRKSKLQLFGRLAIYICLSAAIFATGCSDKTRKCSDEQTLSLLVDLVADNIKLDAEPNRIKRLLEFSIPLPTSFEENIGKYNCSAQLHIGEKFKTTVSYFSQLDDAKQHQVVGFGDFSKIELLAIQGALQAEITNKPAGDNGTKTDKRTTSGATEAIKVGLQAALRSQYPEHLADKGCWVGHPIESTQRYCMKEDRVNEITVDGVKRLYVLLSGTAISESGEDETIHVVTGIVGAFVFTERYGQLELIAGNPAIDVGASGTAPTEWKFVKLGPSDYWGWQNTWGDCHHGYCGSRYSVLAPYGKSIRELAGFNASYSDGNCTGDRCTNIESTFSIDETKTTEKVFPLLLTVSGTDNGAKLGRRWPITFDQKKWRYTEPTNWPLNDREF